MFDILITNTNGKTKCNIETYNNSAHNEYNCLKFYVLLNVIYFNLLNDIALNSFFVKQVFSKYFMICKSF